jgi:hypothetical protein
MSMLAIIRPRHSAAAGFGVDAERFAAGWLCIANSAKLQLCLAGEYPRSLAKIVQLTKRIAFCL